MIRNRTLQQVMFADQQNRLKTGLSLSTSTAPCGLHASGAAFSVLLTSFTQPSFSASFTSKAPHLLVCNVFNSLDPLTGHLRPCYCPIISSLRFMVRSCLAVIPWLPRTLSVTWQKLTPLMNSQKPEESDNCLHTLSQPAGLPMRGDVIKKQFTAEFSGSVRSEQAVFNHY